MYTTPFSFFWKPHGNNPMFFPGFPGKVDPDFISPEKQWIQMPWDPKQEKFRDIKRIDRLEFYNSCFFFESFLNSKITRKNVREEFSTSADIQMIFQNISKPKNPKKILQLFGVTLLGKQGKKKKEDRNLKYFEDHLQLLRGKSDEKLPVSCHFDDFFTFVEEYESENILIRGIIIDDKNVIHVSKRNGKAARFYLYGLIERSNDKKYYFNFIVPDNSNSDKFRDQQETYPILNVSYYTLYNRLDVGDVKNQNNLNQNEIKSFETDFMKIIVQTKQKNKEFNCGGDYMISTIHQLALYLSATNFALNNEKNISNILNFNEVFFNFKKNDRPSSLDISSFPQAIQHKSCQQYYYNITLHPKNEEKNPINIASHFTIRSNMELCNMYVTIKFDFFAIFFYDNRYFIFRGIVGDQSTEDMELLAKIESEKTEDKNIKEESEKTPDKNIKIEFDIENVALKIQIGSIYFDKISLCNTHSSIDETTHSSNDETTHSSIDKTTSISFSNNEGKNSPSSSDGNINFPLNKVYPFALEINRKLFLCINSNKLYHPKTISYSLKNIEYLFFQFFNHVLKNNCEGDYNMFKNGSQAVIIPQIDIGFTGKIDLKWKCGPVPGIYWRFDENVKFSQFKNTNGIQTCFLYFNNGQINCCVDFHRTKCQLASAALFGYGCTIYGPNIYERDFVFDNAPIHQQQNPWFSEKFEFMKKLIIATYGMLLETESEGEFQWALDWVISFLTQSDGDNVSKEFLANKYKYLLDELNLNNH